MLETSLKHVETEEAYRNTIKDNECVMICCGRMGPMCVPVYEAMENLRSRYPHVFFTDMDFDISVSAVIRQMPECRSFMGLPFTVYFKNGKVIRATSSIQTEGQIAKILDEVFTGVTKA